MNTYVVIGSSAAGMGVLSKLRSLDRTSRIICISASSLMPYNTCLLADMLSGLRKNVHTKNENFFKDNDIELYLNTHLTSINPSEQVIETTSGNFTYTKLFLGLGTSSRVDGLSFHTLEDTQKLLDKVESIKSATIIGAGLSGVECSDSLAAHGIKVNLIESQSHLLPAQVDACGSKIIEQLMPKHGVTFYPGVMAKVDGNNVTLSTGEVLNSDVIIFATGGRPNIDIAKRAGIKVDEGIIVDRFMQTSIDNIYAGGDVAMVPNMLTGKLTRSCMWPDAMMQGMHAAFAMTNSPRPYPGVLIVGSSNFYGITFVSCGDVVKSSYPAIIRNGDDYYHKFIVKDDRLYGFLMVNNVKNVGGLRKAVLSGSSASEVLESVL